MKQTFAGTGLVTNRSEITISAGSPNLQGEFVNRGTIRHGDAFVDFDSATAKLRLTSEGLYETVNVANNWSFRQINGGAPGVSMEPGSLFRHNSPNNAQFLTGGSVPFSNLGTVEVTRGTLRFDGLLAQRTGPANGATLAGGAWDVAKNATLDLNVTALVANAGDLTLRGGSISGVAALATNSGTLRLLDGSDFTALPFTNAGTLVLGPDSVFTTPAITQPASGTVEFQIGGLIAGGTHGRLAMTGAATLAGTARVAIEGAFGSLAGQVVTVMTVGSRAGNFTAFDGFTIEGIPYFEALTTPATLKIRSLRDAADLRPEAVTAPLEAFLGQPVTVGFTVRNLEDSATLRSIWTDAVYLSADRFLDAADTRLGSVLHTGGLAAGASYTASLTAPLPATVPADYFVLVVVDDELQVPDSDRFNNTAIAADTIETDLERLTFGVSENTVIAARQSLYYQLDLPAGADVLLTARLEAPGAARFFAKAGAIPTSTDFDVSATSGLELLQRLAFFGASGESQFILIEGLTAAGAGVDLALSTRTLGFEIVGTGPAELQSIAGQTVTVSGSHFTAGTQVRLVGPGGAIVAPAGFTLQNSNTLVATFDLNGMAPGLFDVRLTDGGAVALADDAVLVMPAQVTHSGTISANQRWFGGLVHYVTGPVTVNAGATLTIDPGAIVKFATLTGLTVQNGATFIADGTLAEPVIFTSIRDDAHGGDTNGDGAATAPLAGDWTMLAVNGNSTFDHAQILYGGGSPFGSWSATAALRTFSGTMTFTNSAIRDSLFDGLLAWGGTVTVENSLFTGIDRAIAAHPGSPVTVRNSTFHDNRIALLTHGGTLSVANSIVAESTESGFQLDFGSFLGATNTDVFSAVAGSIDYRSQPDLTGTSGNFSADPRFQNPAAGDFRLRFGSPAIDAGSGSLAPALDARGLPRYDDPRTPNFGTGTPAFADLGAFEFVEGAPSQLDLVVTAVSAPPASLGGDIARITWTVRNSGTASAAGAWHDTLQLVSNAGTVVLVAETVVSRATLGAGQSATFSADITVPFGTEGQYRWQVKTNSQGEIFEGPNAGNNVGTATERTLLQVPTLLIGGTVSGDFETVGGALLYKLRPAVGSDIRIALDRADAGLTEIFLGVGTAPTSANFFSHTQAAADPGAVIEINGALDTDYYVLVVPRTLPGGDTTFTLSSTVASFDLRGLDVVRGSNTGEVTVPLRGSQFGPALTAQLISPGGDAIPASAVRVDNSGLAYATFQLTGADPGAYDVRVAFGTSADTLPDAFQVVAGTAGDQIRTQIILPERVRVGRIFTGYLEYTNTGLTDALAPVIQLTSTTGNLLRFSADDALAAELRFVGVSDSGDAGILRPGETVRIPFQSEGRAGTNTFQPFVSTRTETPFDFTALKMLLRPADASPFWDGIFEAAVRGTRTTTADYVELLSSTATLAAERTGERLTDISTLLGFAMREAFLDQYTKIRGQLFLGDALHPAAGVTVTAENVADGSIISAVSTADGLLRFVQLPAGLAPAGTSPATAAPGTYRISVDGVLAPEGLDLVVVPASGAAPEVTWIARVGGPISGIAKLPGGVAFDPLDPPVVAATNATGRTFLVEAEAGGAYRLAGLPDGIYSVALSGGDDFAASPAFAGIAISNGAQVALDPLVATLGGTVSGVVTGPGGAPLAGVRVTASDLAHSVSDTTDANGVYTLEHVPAGAHLIRAGLANFVLGDRAGVPVADGGVTAGQNFSLTRYSSVTGVVTRDGTPVAGVTVQAQGPGGVLLSLGETGADGRYVLPTLAPGSYSFVIDNHRYGLFTEAVTLGAGEDQVNDVALAAAPSVSGVVRQAGTGAPLDRVVVHLLTPAGDIVKTFTQADGSWAFGRLPAGSYTAMLPDGSHRHEFTITAGTPAATANFDLAVGTLSGEIRLPGGTLPNGGARVFLMKGGQVVQTSIVGADGLYGFVLISPGAFDLAVADGEYDYALRTGVQVAAGVETVVAPLVPGTASLKVAITSGLLDGPVGLPGVVIVTQLGIPGSSERSNVVDLPPSGEITLGSLAPGEYLIRAQAPGLAEVRRIITILPGENALTVASTQAATFAGLIQQGSTGIAGLLVIAYDPATPRVVFEATTDSTGRYAFDNLPGGTFSVVVSDQRPGEPAVSFGAVNLGSVTVAPGSATVRNATVAPATVTLAGRIADGATHVPTSGIVHAANADGVRVARAVVDLNGNYTFDTLATGIYTISAETPGFVVTPRSTSLVEGTASAGVDLVADWVVDPSIGGLFQTLDGITSSAFDYVFDKAKQAVKFVLDKPTEASEMEIPPFSLLGPDCPCPEASLLYARALITDDQVKAAFAALLERYDGYVGWNLANAGLFGVQLAQYVTSIYTTFVAGPVAAAKAIPQLDDAVSYFSNFLTKANASAVAGSPTQNFQKVYSLLENVVDEAFDIFRGESSLGTFAGGVNAGLGLGGGVVDSLKEGELQNFGTSYLDVSNVSQMFFDSPSQQGFLTVIDTAAKFASQINGFAGALLALKSAFAPIAAAVPVPGLLDFLGVALDSVQLAVTASNGLIEFSQTIRDYNQAFEQYEKLVRDRNRLVQQAKHAIIECIVECEDEPEDEDVLPPDRQPKPPGGTGGVGSFDPNDKSTIGFGVGGFIRPETELPYLIRFENVATASAAAQEVFVTDQLSANLDWTTVRLGDLGFNGVIVDVPEGLTHFETDVMVGTDPNPVRVIGDFNPATGLLQWTLRSLDPVTGDLPEDPLAGFLPPNNAQQQGEGFVTWTVSPLAGLASGVTIPNQASIVFDVNAAILTPAVVNTIDRVAPTSSVTALPANSLGANVLVSWAGTDIAGSGVGAHDIFVSDNGAPFTPFLLGTAATSATFTGELGHLYRFYSQAIDNVGNAEAAPTTGDAFVTLGTLVDPKGRTLIDADGDQYKVTLTGPGTARLIEADGGGIALLQLTGTTAKSSLSISVKAKGGDGRVELGAVLGDGALAAFSAARATLTDAGFQLAGPLGKLTLGNVLDGADITFGGTAANKTTLTLGTVGDGTQITTGSTFTALTAAELGDGRIAAAALGKLTTTRGSMDSDLRIGGAVGPVSVKTSVNDGRWVGASFGKITVGAGAFAADVSATGAIGAVIVRSGGLLGDLEARSFGSFSVTGGNLAGNITSIAADLGKVAAIGAVSVTGGDLTGDISVVGKAGAVTARESKLGVGGAITGDIAAASFGAVSLVGGSFSGTITSPTPATVLGKTAALKSLSVLGGDLSGDISLSGKVGKVTVRADKAGVGGDLSGDLLAASFGKVAVTGGDLSGSLTSLTAPTLLGKTAALAGLAISGGDFTGDLRLRGSLGAVSVTASKAGVGGNLADGTISAAGIAALTVAKNVTTSSILAGADLGADFRIGGINEAADQFGAGTIGTVTVGGSVTASRIGAGYTPGIARVLFDDAILGDTASTIAKLIVKGTASPDTRFIAGRFIANPTIGGVKIPLPLVDPRFFTV